MFVRGLVRLQPAYAEDVAESIVRIMQRAETYPMTFECGGPNVYSYEQFLRTVAYHAGLKPLLVSAFAASPMLSCCPICGMIKQIEKIAFDFTAILGEQDVTAAAASLRVSTLLYSGGLSPYLTQRIVGRLASIIPGAEAKHLPRPDTCCRSRMPRSSTLI
jgi:nucleoside-diphosphate-sugar epimerase